MYKFRTLTPDAEDAARPLPRRGAIAPHRGGGDADRPRAARGPPRRGPAALERPARRHGGRRAAADPPGLLHRALPQEIPQYWQRLVVRPGVTGFAQTRDDPRGVVGDKLAHDMEYIADRSVPLYFSVLLATVVKVARPRARGSRPDQRTRLTSTAAGMCGICGVVDRGGAARTSTWSRRMSGAARPPRARQRRPLRRRAGRAGGAAALDHRPRGRRPADRQRGRHGRRRPERRDLQLPRAARRARARRPPLRDRLRHRGPRPPLRGARRRLRRAPARDVRDRALGLARRAPAARPRPLRDQAALLPLAGGALSFASELEGAARAAGLSREIDPRRSRPSSPSTRSRRR